MSRYHMRPYAGESDYWRIREFLREVFRLNARRELSWPVHRFDYFWWHVHANIERHRLDEVIFIWETTDGRVAAVLNPESRGNAFLQVHPGFRSLALEDEMREMAERRLAVQQGDRRRLCVWCDGNDEGRRTSLSRSGYFQAGKKPEFQRRRSLLEPVPGAPVPEGYTVRSLGDADELPARSWVSWRAFHPDEPDDRYEGWEWYRNVQRAPLYRRDLDIVAVAPDGRFAAFCTVWFDDVNRTASFEPVGTDPEHQRRGLGRAVMLEGLRRARRLGATQAHVGSYTPGAHGLYESVGFVEYDLCEPWIKELGSAGPIRREPDRYRGS